MRSGNIWRLVTIEIRCNRHRSLEVVNEMFHVVVRLYSCRECCLNIETAQRLRYFLSARKLYLLRIALAEQNRLICYRSLCLSWKFYDHFSCQKDPVGSSEV
jgi:hypothetical protein